MFRWRPFSLTAALAVLIAAPLAAEESDNADPVVQYRIAVMKGMAANASAIGLTIRNELPQTQNLARHTQAIALDARAALSAFESKVPDGVAKPVVWEKWNDFAARLTQLADSADEVTRIIQDQGPVVARSKLESTLSQCKSCHDIYRKK